MDVIARPFADSQIPDIMYRYLRSQVPLVERTRFIGVLEKCWSVKELRSWFSSTCNSKGKINHKFASKNKDFGSVA